MSVSSIANAAGAKPSPTASSESAPGIVKANPKETFMRLMVAQLEHQNPLEPMDNTQFTAQLAQFTSLEQLQAMNANLSALMNAQTTTNGLQAATLIGKEIQAQSNTTQVRQQGGSPFQYTLDADSATVQINVMDQAGNIVRTIEAANQPKAVSQRLDWNGKDNQGRPLPEGEYHFTVTAQDKAGKPVATATLLTGTVASVAYEGTHPYLMVLDTRENKEQRVEISALTNVKQSK